MFDSSDDEDIQTTQNARSSMKSIFESDKRSKLSGDQSLSYDGGRSKREQAQAAGQGGGPPGSASGNTIAKQSAAICYRGETQIGTCAVVLMVTPSTHLIALIDRERRPQARVRVDAEMQLLQNNNELQYATLYDPAIQQHWTLMFKTEADCTAFVVAALTMQHYLLLGEGPRQHFTDVTECFDGDKARKGDVATIAWKAWLLTRVGSGSTFCSGKDIEEIAYEAPRKVTVGNGTIMCGIEEALPATPVGTRRLLFLPGKKCKVNRGLGNPEIGPSDSAVVLLTVIKVAPSEDLPSFGGDDDEDDLLAPGGGRSKSRGKSQPSPEPAQPKAIEAPPAAAPPPAASPASPAPPANDTNTLIQTMLLQTLQMQNQPKPQPEPSEGQTSVFVERSLDRIHQQLSGLYEKIDRIDIDKKLQANNDALERMMKKAVGKLPVNEVDIEDMSKDRDQLLAKIEAQKQRMEEMTDRYHKALEQLGQHKETTAALKNDLRIQQEAAEKAIEELKSRKRLEGVDLEVKYRAQLDRATDDAFKKGREEGFKDGYNSGKVDAMTIAGSSTTEELRKIIEQKETSIVDWQMKVTQMESKHYEERRQHGDQVQTLNTLIRRLEQREEARKKDMLDQAAGTGKAMKRIMNNTYSSIESQVYAMGQEAVNTEEVLQLILMTIKSESRQAIDDFKREAAERASAPLDLPEDDGVPMVEHQPPPSASSGGPPLPPQVENDNFKFAIPPPEVDVSALPAATSSDASPVLTVPPPSSNAYADPNAAYHAPPPPMIPVAAATAEEQSDAFAAPPPVVQLGDTDNWSALPPPPVVMMNGAEDAHSTDIPPPHVDLEPPTVGSPSSPDHGDGVGDAYVAPPPMDTAPLVQEENGGDDHDDW